MEIIIMFLCVKYLIQYAKKKHQALADFYVFDKYKISYTYKLKRYCKVYFKFYEFKAFLKT